MAVEHITPTPESRLKDFQAISFDILKLMAYFSKSEYKEQKRAAEIIENFYDQCHAIISNQCLDLHASRLISTTEHVKATMLAAELKGVYNELYNKDKGLALDMLKRSYVPTRKELEAPITPFKTPDINEILG